jgi:predicted SAM-dependent methyltransferase
MAKSAKEKVYGIPVAGYLLHLIDAFFRLPRNDARVKELRARVRELEGRRARASGAAAPLSVGAGTADQHLPALLNALETVPALSHEIVRTRRELDTLRAEIATDRGASTAERQATAGRERQETAERDLRDEIGRIWQRLEFVRMEIMYEMNHGPRGMDLSDQPRQVEPRILDADKVDAQMRDLGGVRLNLGCGHVPLEGYLNTDMRDLPGVDVVADVSNLPFEPGQAKEIFSAHLLEHFPQERLVRSLLPHWHGLLAEGGTFRAITPDGAAMIDAAGAGTYDYEDFRTVLFGAQEYDGDFHFNLLTPQSLGALLEEAGFADIRILEVGRRNGRCFEFEISATKPSAA